MKNNSKGAIIISLFILTALLTTAYQFQSSFGFPYTCLDARQGKAPIAVSGNNVYVAWWGNSSGNYEVMFKSSNNGGQTFGDKINLSNSTNGTFCGSRYCYIRE